MMRLAGQLVLAFALLAALAAATPSSTMKPLHGKRRTFSVRQKAATVPAKANQGYHDLAHSLRKFGHKPPPLKTKSKTKKLHGAKQKDAAAGDSAETATPDAQDTQYICEVDVAGTKFRLNFDTGSSDLWIYGSKLNDTAKKDHKSYNVDRLKTGKPMEGGQWNITYGDGSYASGTVYTDAVTVGKTVVQQQAIEVANNISDSFATDNSNDGLLGLGFTSGSKEGAGNTITINGSPKPQKTFFENARDRLPKPLFTADLKLKAPGSYDFGFIDSKRYTGDIKYFPAKTDDAYWGVTSDSWGVGGQNHDDKIRSIVDTGTTLLLMPQKVLDVYYKEVKGAKNDSSAGGYVFPCDAKLPDFTIGFGAGGDNGSFTAVIAAKYMNYGPVTPGDTSKCFGGLQSMAPDEKLDAIYGDIFLKPVFTVFEAKTNDAARLGFAMKPGEPAASSATAATAPPDSSSGGGSGGTSDPCSSGDDSDDDAKKKANPAAKAAKAVMDFTTTKILGKKVGLDGKKSKTAHNGKDACPAPSSGGGGDDDLLGIFGDDDGGKDKESDKDDPDLADDDDDEESGKGDSSDGDNKGVLGGPDDDSVSGSLWVGAPGTNNGGKEGEGKEGEEEEEEKEEKEEEHEGGHEEHEEHEAEHGEHKEHEEHEEEHGEHKEHAKEHGEHKEVEESSHGGEHAEKAHGEEKEEEAEKDAEAKEQAVEKEFENKEEKVEKEFAEKEGKVEKEFEHKEQEVEKEHEVKEKEVEHEHVAKLHHLDLAAAAAHGAHKQHSAHGGHSKAARPAIHHSDKHRGSHRHDKSRAHAYNPSSKHSLWRGDKHSHNPWSNHRHSPFSNKYGHGPSSKMGSHKTGYEGSKKESHGAPPKKPEGRVANKIAKIDQKIDDKKARMKSQIKTRLHDIRQGVKAKQGQKKT